MACDVCYHLAKAKDWIYVICTPIQTIVAIVVLVCVHWWWDRRKTKDAHRQRERDREDARQKSAAEKLAAVLGQKYDDVENIYHNFKKNVDKLNANCVNGGFTEFHVLLYMCHPGNKERFDKTTDTADQQSISSVVSDVDEIMKFFIEFRLQLTSIHDRKCPRDIREEFSTEIIEMGKTIYPFVKEHRQKVIEKVLKYFASTDSVQESNTPAQCSSCIQCCFPSCFPCRRMQSTSRSPGRQGEHDGQEMDTLLNGNQDANQGLTPYPGTLQIKGAIPYIEFFRYEKGEMKIGCKYSNLANLEQHVKERREEIMNMEAGLKGEIGVLLRYAHVPEDDLLHLIRLVMLKIKDETNNFNTEKKKQSLKRFVAYVKQIDCSLVPLDACKMECERKLHDIKIFITDLERQHVVLLNLNATSEFLTEMEEKFGQFIHSNK